MGRILTKTDLAAMIHFLKAILKIACPGNDALLFTAITTPEAKQCKRVQTAPIIGGTITGSYLSKRKRKEVGNAT